MTNLDKEIAAIDDTLRSFNINRPDIKEIWETGKFGTIAVPADRYKQYYDIIKRLQAQLAERDKVIAELQRELEHHFNPPEFTQLPNEY